MTPSWTNRKASLTTSYAVPIMVLDFTHSKSSRMTATTGTTRELKNFSLTCAKMKTLRDYVQSTHVADAEHQKDWRGDVEYDHADDERHIPTRKRCGTSSLSPLDQQHDPDADSRAKIQQCRHRGRLDRLEQKLRERNVDRVE